MDQYISTNENPSPDAAFRPDEKWLKLFNLSLNARKIKGFNPADFLILGNHDSKSDNEQPMYLPLEVKRLWFYYWLEENNFKGSIITHQPKITFNVEVPNKRVGFVEAECDIIINGEIIASNSAGLVIDLGDTTQMSIAIQAVTGNAQSRALSSAGFGCVPKLGPEVDPKRNLSSSFNSAGLENNLPYFISGEFVPDASAAPSPSTSPAIEPQQQIVDPALAQQFDSLNQSAADPVTLAKNEVCPIKGSFEGKTIGDMLASGGTYYLCRYALKFQPRSPEQEAFQQAAKLVWDSLNDAVKNPILKKHGLL